MTSTRLALPCSISVCLSVLGCAERTDVSPDNLGLAVRSAGIQCEEVVETEAFGTDSWRVECNSGLTYVASFLEDGGICIDPVPLGDPRRGGLLGSCIQVQ
jgi:hypothetical protein